MTGTARLAWVSPSPDGDRSLIEYNCLSKMGDYGLNIGGVDDVFEYNEIYDTNFNADPGCGCSGGGKWWGSLNADIIDNAFVDDGPGGSVPSGWTTETPAP